MAEAEPEELGKAVIGKVQDDTPSSSPIESLTPVAASKESPSIESAQEKAKLLEESKQRSLNYIAGAQSLLTVVILVLACVAAFSSRLFAVIRFESIIHEFDPWYAELLPMLSISVQTMIIHHGNKS